MSRFAFKEGFCDVGTLPTTPYTTPKTQKDSPFDWAKTMMSFLNLADLARGKYFFRNFLTTISQLVSVPYDRDFNQALALSLNEKWNNLSRIASSMAPLIFMVL